MFAVAKATVGIWVTSASLILVKRRMKKPEIKRFYRNMKTGQYCELSGYPSAVNHAVEFMRKVKKLVLKRVSEREHDANRQRIGETVKYVGRCYPYHPHCTARKDLRLAKLNPEKRKEMFLHQMFYSYDGIWS
jgi:hypothetical protein